MSDAMRKFIEVAGRFVPLFFVITENELPNALVKIGLGSLSNEIEQAIEIARQRWSSLDILLRLDETEQSATFAYDLRRLCEIRLLTLDEREEFKLDVETYGDWFKSIEETEQEFGDLEVRLIDYSLPY